MTEEQKATYVIARAIHAMGMILGMAAENMQRETLGQSMAYGGKDFFDAVAGLGENEALKLFHGQPAHCRALD